MKAAREEIVGDFAIAYARDPSQYDQIKLLFESLTPFDKSLTPSNKEQAGAVKAVGKTILAYMINPSCKETLFGTNKEGNHILEYYGNAKNINSNSEEVNVAKAETLEVIIDALERNSKMYNEIIDKYLGYVGKFENLSPKVQAIIMYNSGKVLDLMQYTDFSLLRDKYINNLMPKKFDEFDERIQAASMANLGRLYFNIWKLDENLKDDIFTLFENNLYIRPTSNSPIIQAAQCFCDGYYDSAYQSIMRIEDKSKRENSLKLLEYAKNKYDPNIKINYSLDEVKIAKMEFLNEIFYSYSYDNGKYFNTGRSRGYIPPSESYFSNKK